MSSAVKLTPLQTYIRLLTLITPPDEPWTSYRSMSLAFLDLPEDILLEILAHLLVDTPRCPYKAGLLRTCTHLYALGTPLLYRVVDLTGHRSALEALAHWRSLFGPRGTLSKRGSRPELGAYVRELRLGLPGMRKKRDRLRVALDSESDDSIR